MSQIKSESLKFKYEKDVCKTVDIQKNNRSARKTVRPPKKITSSYLHNAGLFYLERFAASKKHFIRILMRKVKKSCDYHLDQNFEHCQKLVYETADKFEKSGLLNDELYASGMAKSLRRRGLSKNAILKKMTMKGLDSDLAKSSLEQNDTAEYDNKNNAEICSALKLARKKKMGPFSIENETDPKIKQRHLGRFARSGFSYEVTKLIMDMSEEDVEKYN